jgi:hypothetical protein
MARTEQRLFTTLDIYLAGFLALNGISPKLEVRNARVVFTFEANDQLYRLMNLFNGNVNVPVADFVTIVKTLRGKMLTVKESIGGNGKGARNGYPKDF